jgi:hypothetical protein
MIARLTYEEFLRAKEHLKDVRETGHPDPLQRVLAVYYLIGKAAKERREFTQRYCKAAEQEAAIPDLFEALA